MLSGSNLTGFLKDKWKRIGIRVVYRLIKIITDIRRCGKSVMQMLYGFLHQRDEARFSIFSSQAKYMPVPANPPTKKKDRMSRSPFLDIIFPLRPGIREARSGTDPLWRQGG